MPGKSTRAVLMRLYGFAEPLAQPDGTVRYECLFCGGQTTGSTVSHAADCSYWVALPSFETPAGAALLTRASGAAQRVQ